MDIPEADHAVPRVTAAPVMGTQSDRHPDVARKRIADVLLPSVAHDAAAADTAANAGNDDTTSGASMLRRCLVLLSVTRVGAGTGTLPREPLVSYCCIN